MRTFANCWPTIGRPPTDRRAASVKSATTNAVVVLIFIDQSVSNRNSPMPQIDRSRIMIMDKVNGRWLASKVEL